MTAIDDEWQEHPWLGAPVDEQAARRWRCPPDAGGRDFENGPIYWTRSTAHTRCMRASV
jgi:hypothetical protein